MSPTHTFRPRNIDIQHVTFAGSLALRLVGPASDTATVLLRGGQLVSWINAEGREMLQGGGLSVQIAQDNEDGPLAHLRRTRNADWRVHDAWFHRGVPHLSLRLRSRDLAWQSWPCEFDCFLDMALNSPQLLVTLKVVNTGHKALRFRAAMQPRFRLFPNPAGAWSSISDTVSLPCLDGRLELHTLGFQEVSVWSPWWCRDKEPGAVPLEGARPVSALVCVDAGTAGQTLKLAPGSHWLGAQHMGWHAQLPD